KAEDSRPAIYRHKDFAADHGDYGDYMTAGFGVITDRIQAFETDGFQLGTSNVVNNDTTIYNYVAMKSNTTMFQQGQFAGTGLDNKNISGVGFRPNFVIVKNSTPGGSPNFFTLEGIFVTDTTAATKSHQFGSTNNLTDRIQEIQTDGFQVGTDDTVNKDTETIYWMAWKSTYVSQPLTDSLSVAENNKKTPTRIDTDSLQLSESNFSSYVKNALASINLSITNKSDIGRSDTDSLSMTENIELISVYQRALSEALSFTENFKKETILKKLNSISVGETQIKEIEKTSTDIASLIDTVSLGSAIEKSDVVSLAELILKEAKLSFTESLNLAETLLVTSTFEKNVAEILTILETLQTENTFRRALFETLNILEILEKEIQKIFTNTITTSEDRVFEINVLNTENLALSEFLTHTIGLTKEESVALIEISNRESIIERQFSETLQIAEVVSFVSVFEKNFIKNLIITEVLSKEAEIPILDSVAIVDNFVSESGTDVDPVENISIAEKLSFVSNISKEESLSLVETLSKEFSAERTLVESLNIIEQITKDSSYSRTESLPISEEIKKSYGVVFIDTVIATEVFKKFIGLTNTDSLVISENLLKDISLLSFAESVEIAESSSIIRGRNEAPVDQIAIAEELDAVRTFNKDLLDAIALLDNMEISTEKRKDVTIIITDQTVPGFGTTRTDEFSISEEFSRNVFIGIIELEGIAETLVKDYGLTVIDSLAITEQIKESGQVEPLKRKTYLFTKGNKSYLFHRIRR
ncbi:MAG: hypothetical protein KJI69_05945, partial [Patescibacteria group bacterium]|nr:hypothetical protein [Patescibacteria group bacterium]